MTGYRVDLYTLDYGRKQILHYLSLRKLTCEGTMYDVTREYIPVTKLYATLK